MQTIPSCYIWLERDPVGLGTGLVTIANELLSHSTCIYPDAKNALAAVEGTLVRVLAVVGVAWVGFVFRVSDGWGYGERNG